MEQKLPKPLIFGMLASIVTGIITLLLLKRNADQRERPPKGAPQLDIDNPGRQDEFLTSASESEVG